MFSVKNNATDVIAIPDEYVDMAILYLEHIRDSQFALGDLLVQLVDTYGGLKAPVINYMAGKTNRAPTTLYDYEAVARRWPREYRERYPNLDYTIFRNADPVLDEELLNSAADEDMSPTKFKELKYPALLEPSNVLRNALYALGRITFNDERIDKIRKLIEDILKDLN